MLDVVDNNALLVQHFINRAQSLGSALALPVDLHCEEGLREAAFRAAARNAFRNTKITVELAKANSFRSLSALHEGTADELDRLVSVLGIRKDAEQIKMLLARKKHAGKDWVSFFGIDIRRGHLAKERRVAPRSLAVASRQKATWSLRPFGFDLETKELLLDSCPVCQLKLGWPRTFGVSFCDKCPSAVDPLQGGTDLSKYPQPIIDVEDAESLQFVTDLVNPTSMPRLATLHPDFTGIGRGDIFQFAVEIGNFLDDNSAGWGGALRPSSLERAGRAVLDWPKAFDDLLDECSPCWETRSRSLGKLQSEVRLSSSIRGLLKERYDGMLRRRAARKVGTVRDGGYSPPPKRILGHCRAELRRLASGSNDVAPVVAAVTILRESKLARRLADTLGLPVPYLLDLFDAGFLPELEPVLASLKSAPRIALEGSLVDNLQRLAQTDRLAAQDLPMWPTAFALANLNGAQWVAIFRALFSGNFPVSLSSAKGMIVRRLYHSDVDAFARSLRPNCESCPSDFVPLTQCEISSALGKSRTAVCDLISNGIIGRNATGFDLAELRKDWMFISEARDLALLNGRRDLHEMQQIFDKANISRLPTGKIGLWSRSGVMRLFQ